MDAAKQEAGLVAAALTTPERQLFPSWLVGKTLMRPSAEGTLAAATAEAYAIAKARREGQNGLVFMILHALEVARDGTGRTAGAA